MTKSIDSQKIEEQGYQAGLINSLIDLAQDNLGYLNESLIKYNHHEFTNDELILDVKEFLPKIDTLLKVAFDKSADSKEQLYQIVLDSLHSDTTKKDGE